MKIQAYLKPFIKYPDGRKEMIQPSHVNRYSNEKIVFHIIVYHMIQEVHEWHGSYELRWETSTEVAKSPEFELTNFKSIYEPGETNTYISVYFGGISFMWQNNVGIIPTADVFEI